ncbi:MAG: cation:dicarboxylase symporter family transporter, partial [Thermodesulfobacteriota bacterium]
LQMCVLPVILVTVVNSLGLVLREGGVRRVLLRLVVTTALGTLLVSAFGALGTGVAGIGADLDLASKNVLGEFLSQHEERFKQPAEDAGDGKGLWGFVANVVPENIFADLAAGNTLSVLFFAALLGLALGMGSRGSGSEIFAVLESLYGALSRIVQGLMYALPLGMCCLIASMLAAAGVDILLGASWFIVFLYTGILGVMVAGSLVVWRRAGGSYLASLSALRRPLLVGLGNGRPVAAIPQAIDSLTGELGFDSRTTRLIVPLTFSTISFGNILHFSASAIFLSRLYGAPLGLQEYALIVLASVVAGIAAANSPGIIALSMMGIVLGLLKLPLAPSIALLFALDPLLDQPLALASVSGNCACTALVAEVSGRRPPLTANQGG